MPRDCTPLCPCPLPPIGSFIGCHTVPVTCQLSLWELSLGTSVWSFLVDANDVFASSRRKSMCFIFKQTTIPISTETRPE